MVRYLHQWWVLVSLLVLTASPDLFGAPGLGPCPDGAFVSAVTPAEGFAGDVITITGVDLSEEVTGNRVVFRDSSNLVRVAGKVLTIDELGPHPCGVEFRLTVLVPTRAPAGFVEVTAAGEPAGELAFEAGPIVVGVAIGNTGDLGFVRRTSTGYAPPRFVLYGYNLKSMTASMIRDSIGRVFGGAVTAGIPSTATYSIPESMDAVTCEIPPGILVKCFLGIGPFDSLPISLTGFSSSGTPLESNRISVPFTTDPVQGIPATFSGVRTSSGIRSGHIAIEFNLLQQPASAFWDVVPEYLDPTSGEFRPCTAADTDVDGVGIPAGVLKMRSDTPAIIGPGHTHRFIWNSPADLAGTQTTTQLRLQPANPQPRLGIICETGEWLTERVVVDNSRSDGAVVETFDTNEFEDSDETDAFWSDPAGLLVGAPIGEVPTGEGFVDLTLFANHAYEMNTEMGTILDVTDPLNPGVLVDDFNNPGAALGEFHLRTFHLEDGGDVAVLGSRPLVIRCAGTGNRREVALRIDGDLNLDGAHGTSVGLAGPGLAGVGGAAGPGGGAGGNGACVVVQPFGQIVTDLIPAERGENDGGEAGPSLTYLRLLGLSVARVGPGGGGGFATRGGEGTQPEQAAITTRVGAGGPARGDPQLTILRGGSGGGGGGAMPYRPQQLAQIIQVRNGGGGGGGGGAVELTANGSVKIEGFITANGGDGGGGEPPTGGPGGGGSGGGIAVRATGNLRVTPQANLRARGGQGGFTALHFVGGNGADGRIRLEANGILAISGNADLSGVEPELPPASLAGPTAAPVGGGSGADGSLDLTGVRGEVIVNTDTGEIHDPNGKLLLTGTGGAGTFEFITLVIPEDVTVRAFGENPLILEVAESADILGTIDVSGFDGQEMDLREPELPRPGAGGAPGPGGGRGGDGGVQDGRERRRGESGGLPPHLPAELIADFLSSIPPDPTGQPIAVPLAVRATGGESRDEPCGLGRFCRAGSGGGGGYGAPGQNAATTIGQFVDGRGGSVYGGAHFHSPLDGSFLPVGGGGGGGGGGNRTTGLPPGVRHVPGTGGGGGGGFLQIAVNGPLAIHGSARILARGGNAVSAAGFGGNGGAGAGGGILLQSEGPLSIQTAPSGVGPTISVRGGEANLSPRGYVGNGLVSAGNGGQGRVRVESSVPILLNPTSGCAVSTRGICPTASVGCFAAAGTRLSQARSLPYSIVADDRASVLSPARFLGTDLNLLPPPTGTFIRVLFEGARESSTTPGAPGSFSSPVGSLGDLEGAEFIRIRWFLYSNADTGESPAVDGITVSYSR